MTGDETRSVSITLPGHLIRRLHQISTAVFQERLQALGHDITPLQFAMLDALGHNQNIDQKTLADLVAKDRATLGAAVERLERKGLVDRRVSPSDKRARVLALTEEGELLLEELLPIVVALQKDILPGLDEDEFQQFVRLAAKVAAATQSGED